MPASLARSRHRYRSGRSRLQMMTMTTLLQCTAAAMTATTGELRQSSLPPPHLPRREVWAS
jgi:hypothetical protein